MTALPATPPFALRARLLSPLADGGWLDVADGLVEVDGSGRIAAAGAWPGGEAPASVVDLRPLVVLPGLVDLHAHLPQLPNAGLGSGLGLDVAGMRRLVSGALTSLGTVASEVVNDVVSEIRQLTRGTSEDDAER